MQGILILFGSFSCCFCCVLQVWTKSHEAFAAQEGSVKKQVYDVAIAVDCCCLLHVVFNVAAIATTAFAAVMYHCVLIYAAGK